MGPDTVVIRHDLSLTFAEFDAIGNHQRFIGHRLFPLLAVDFQNAQFVKLPIEEMLAPADGAERAEAAAYGSDTFEWDHDSYQTREHGFEEPLDDRDAAKWGNRPRLVRVARTRILHRLRTEYEVASAAVVDALPHRRTVSKPWTDKAGVDPIADIDAARVEFIDRCGMTPNTLALEHAALLAMIRTDRVEARLGFSGIAAEGQVDPRAVPALSQLLQVEQIVIADTAMKRISRSPDNLTFGRIWDPSVGLLARTSTAEDLEAPEASLGRTLVWIGDRVDLDDQDDADGEGLAVTFEEYRDEPVRGNRLRGRSDYTIKLIHQPAGLVLDGLI